MQIPSQRPEWRETIAKQSSPVKAPARAGDATAGVGVGESNVLKAALGVMQAAPEVDLERVAEVRAALSRGEIKFDAQRVAALVERFHGGHG